MLRHSGQTLLSMCNSVFIMHGINEWSIHASSIEIFPKEMETLILYLTLLYPTLPFLLPPTSLYVLVYHLQRTLQIWLSKIRKWFACAIGAASPKRVKFELCTCFWLLKIKNLPPSQVPYSKPSLFHSHPPTHTHPLGQCWLEPPLLVFF